MSEAWQLLDDGCALKIEQPMSLTFCLSDGSTVLRLTPDRRVIWEGEQTEAALAFWRVVETCWPTFIVQTAHK